MLEGGAVDGAEQNGSILRLARYRWTNVSHNLGNDVMQCLGVGLCQRRRGMREPEMGKEQRHSFSARHALTDTELFGESEKGKFVTHEDSHLLV